MSSALFKITYAPVWSGENLRPEGQIAATKASLVVAAFDVERAIGKVRERVIGGTNALGLRLSDISVFDVQRIVDKIDVD